MTGIALRAAAARLMRVLSLALVARVDRSRGAVARHLRLCLTSAWLGPAGLAWGATPLDVGSGEVVFLVGGPLGGLCVWLPSSGENNGPGDDPPPDDDGDPPEWDWERFERDLAVHQARNAVLRP